MSDLEKPKYQILKEYITETITKNELKPGDRIFSENVLAEKFGVSRHTVRQAVGELVSEGWLFRVHGKGTFVGAGPSGKAAPPKTVAVVTTYLNDYIFPSIIRGIDMVLSESGYNIILGCTYNQHEKEKMCLENLKSQNIAGLIVEPTKSALPNPNIDLYMELKARGIPVLFIHGCYRDLDFPYIVEDDVRAGYEATCHLIGLGHRNIAGIFKIDDIQGHFRFAGYQKAHREEGLEFSDSRVLWFDTDETDMIFKDGSDKRLIDLIEKCSAIVCYNEQIAVKVFDAVRQKGLSIPDDISIVSFDDSQLAVASEVKLTTIAHPKEKFGEEAAKLIISMINKIGNTCSIKMEPKLIVRGSTKQYGR